MKSKEFRNLTLSLARNGAPMEPRCPHAGECGGCAFQDRAYADQVAAKEQALTALWRDEPLLAGLPLPLRVAHSPDVYNYRTRMDYVATKGRFGLRRSGRFNYIVELGECHLIPPAGFAVAYALWQRAVALGLPDYDIRNHTGFVRYVVVRRSPQNQFLLAMVTAQGPYESALEELAALALAQPGVVGFHWLLNDSLTDLSFGTPLRHWGAEMLPMQVGPNMLAIGPNTFFQNNVHLLLPLLDDVLAAVTADINDTKPAVADLYGGVGTIALHLAPHVSRVVTVESVQESAILAQRNCESNGISHVETVAADVVDFLRQAQPGVFEVMVADPPRTGLGPQVCGELLRLAPQRIVYVSCNPLTQREDLHMLGAAYRLTALRGYDMFPHTPHVETLAILEHVT
ncbi:MAG: methyltransferase [Chloroflexaceae bacterium]|jgi:23S rRNA (uracil-5-)-methyltransferase RumA|nr:methyltransferase [Chloroflexaceae bacterium]